MPDKAFWRVISPWILPVLALVVFSVYALTLVFSVGVGCADDAYHAVIAKNLALGRGYTSTIQDGRTDFLALQFDPRVGVGPVIIFPASLIIRIFGNTYWAPGLAHVLLWSSLCIGIGLLTRKYQSGAGLSLAALSFFYLGFALMTFHFEQWYALLGEIPAALLIILAVLLFFHHNSGLYQCLAGIALSLAAQAKLLSLLAFAVFILCLAIFQMSDRSKKVPARLKELIHRTVYLSIGFIIPVLTFEIWKLFELGPSGYMNNVGSYVSFVKNKGIDHGQALSLLALYKARAAIIYDRFGIALQSVGFMLALAGLLISRDKKLWRIYIVFVSMIIFYLFWWIFISVGWARYFIIPLILIIGAASLPFLASYHRKWLWLYFILIVIWPAGTWDRLAYPSSFIDSGYFNPTKRTESLLKTSNMLARAHSKNRIITQWWATAADLEYISDSHLIFTTYRDEPYKQATPYLIAADTRFVDPNDKEFIELVNSCRGLSNADIYLVYKCE
ncbi:MAG: hypothetical protein EPN25_03330 [Nitrospirae bacterium]|nr:MAG: hypothetical protein EPN25_03330 [Nitrospirota bacterium]